MVILTAKVSRGKLAVGVLIALAALALVIFLCLQSGGGTAAAEDGTVISTQGATNADRVACLQALGWEVSDQALTSQEVRIPEQWNEVYERYNELQLSQGFDLSKYAGKTVKRYVYAIENHPDTDGQVVATLLVYKDRIIGGDITSTAADGFMHSLLMPEGGTAPEGGSDGGENDDAESTGAAA